MKRNCLLSLSLFLLPVAGFAVPVTTVNLVGLDGPYREPSLQNVIDERGNTLVGISSSDWQVADAGLWTSVGAIHASQVAKYAMLAPYYCFGLYDAANPTNRSMILFGSAIGGDAVSVVSPYDVFGFYLLNSRTNEIWFSDPSLNSLGDPSRLVAYQGAGEMLGLGQNPTDIRGSVAWTSTTFLLGWEAARQADWDYQDSVIVVENVRPLSFAVPDGASTLWLLLAALGSVTALCRKGFVRTGIW